MIGDVALVHPECLGTAREPGTEPVIVVITPGVAGLPPGQAELGVTRIRQIDRVSQPGSHVGAPPYERAVVHRPDRVGIATDRMRTPTEGSTQPAGTAPAELLEGMAQV